MDMVQVEGTLPVAMKKKENKIKEHFPSLLQHLCYFIYLELRF